MIKFGLQYFNYPKVFIEYSNDVNDVHNSTEEYNPWKKRKVLIVFDDMIADTSSYKKPLSVVTDLFIRDKKSNISLAFITQSYFFLPKDLRLNTTTSFP